MDILNIKPNSVNETDDVMEQEGYDNQIQKIQDAYPEVDFRTPAEIAEAKQLEEGTTPQESINPTEVETQNPTPEITPETPASNIAGHETLPIDKPQVPTDQTGITPEVVKEPTKFTFVPDEFGMIDDEQLLRAYGDKLPQGLKTALKMNHSYLDDKEGQLHDLFKYGNNLEKQLEAFNMIRNDSELAARYDHNNDGEITYDDFFDTTNLDEWDPELKRLNPEADKRLTAEWLEALENPTAMARLKALWQDVGPGQNMARYINTRRRHALSDVGEGEEGWFGWNSNVDEGFRQSAAGGLFDITAFATEMQGRIDAFIEEEDISALFKNSDLDESLLQTKNDQSLEYMVNHNLKRSAGDVLAYEAAYWTLPTILTAGTGTAAGGAVKSVGYSTKIPALVKAGNFLTPGVRTGVQVVSKTGTGQVVTKIVQPATGIFGRQAVVKGLNVAKSGIRTVAVTDMPVALFSNLQEDGRGMMQEDGWFQKLGEMYPEHWAFSQQISQGINSPLFKQLDFAATTTMEGGIAIFGIQGIGGGILKQGKRVVGELPQAAGSVTKWGQKNLDQFAVSTKSLSTKIDAEFVNQKYFFEQTQKQLTDLADAARTQMQKAADGYKNPFTPENMSDGILKNGYGVYKNGVKMMGQGYTKARDSVNQIIRDIIEIKNTRFVGKKGSPNSMFSQTDIAKGARSGLNDVDIAAKTKELVEDGNYQRYLNNLDPSKRTIGARTPDALNDIVETVLGRDASRTSPTEFFGEFLDNKVIANKDWTKMSQFDKWAVQNVEVQNAVMKSLLMQLRDMSSASSDMIGKTDIFSVDGPMRNVADNLVSALHQVKRTQFLWDQADEMLTKQGGKFTPADIAKLNRASKAQSKRLLQETKEAVNIMTNMMRERGDEELAGAVLDVFKVSNDIHNWTDFEAFMKQMIVGGKFRGQTKTGDLIKGLQKVMVQSILSGPKTPLRALMGTTVNSYLNTINQALGATLQLPFTRDVATYKASMAKLKGQFELIPEAYQLFQKQWHAKFNANIADIQTRFTEADTQADRLWEAKRIHVEQQGTPGERAAFYINNITRNLTNNKLFSWSPRALAAVDDTFKHLLVRSRSKELAMRQAMEAVGDDWTKITPEMLAKAEDLHYGNLLDADGNINMAADSWLDKQFREVTLTTELTGTAAKMDNLFNDIPLIKPFYLFARTGLNGLNFTYKNTPLLGALHKESVGILKHTGDDFTELAANYGIKNAADLKAARSLFAGRQAMGATVVGSMAMMYQAGQLTGNGPADRQLRQQWLNAGWKPNHFYIVDVGFDYRSLEPFNVIFSSIADIGDNLELMGPEWGEKRLQAIAFVIGRGLQGKTYMSGLDQLMQISQMKPGAMDKAVANLLNNSIPLAGMRNEFGKWVNPHMKELNSDMWSSIRNRNLASEYLTGDPLPNKSDLLNGKPINNWNIIGRSFNAVSPVSLDIRRDTPGRRLLMSSNYDLKSTTYAYNGYSFAENAVVRAHFQNAIGTVPITVGFKKFKNVEEALNYLSKREDVKKSLAEMKSNINDPAAYDINPTTYPHNTLIDNVFNQARRKAWAKINQSDHEGYSAVQKLKAEKDGHTTRTRTNRNEILELANPSKPAELFPK